MEFGNVYEVFQIGDMVKIDDMRRCDDGRTGVIIEEGNSKIEDIPYYKVRLDPIVSNLGRDVKGFDAWVYATSLKRRFSENVEIAMGLRSCKTYLTQIGRCKTVIYEIEKKRKFAEGGNTMKKLDVKKIIFNGPKTIVLWSDGTKTIVSMSKDEPRFDPEAAFCAAYTKKMFGTNSKIKRVIEEKSNIEKWKELNEVPEDQLYKLGLKALGLCEDIDMEAIECVAKEAEKLQDEIVQEMYNTLTGHLYKEDNDGNN